ncbi:MAG TPA: methyltransferase domain-containing protein [Ramlibacter sp.]|jgi:SAM-dependent methyltransferase|uniref:class I SAM-dependent methyltransferase n=1 Tax=Ramlibacter sp. TaxID=1917967 RepID=UPI002D32955A|nr:methyltransferase domain-containing protein [Ramlibacter sp.]HZY16857.1 methyltransferase domain-containing protein [Ramlibacter sp.]
MLPFEQNVADIYGILDTAEGGHSVAQFRSLPQANQYRLLYSLVARHMPRGARVLDWGSGNGHFSFFLARQGATVTSYSYEREPAIFSLLEPAERARVAFVPGAQGGSTSILPFDDASFDCVFSIGVLEHVREMGGSEEGSLAEIHRVLRPGGRFVCYHLPNQFSWIEALNRLVHGPLDPSMRIPWKYHKYRFTRPAIAALCTGAGFSVTEMHRYGALPRNVLGRVPGRLRGSRRLSTALNAIDLVLEKALTPISQNYAFVATRP